MSISNHFIGFGKVWLHQLLINLRCKHHTLLLFILNMHYINSHCYVKCCHYLKWHVYVLAIKSWDVTWLAACISHTPLWTDTHTHTHTHTHGNRWCKIDTLNLCRYWNVFSRDSFLSISNYMPTYKKLSYIYFFYTFAWSLVVQCTSNLQFDY